MKILFLVVLVFAHKSNGYSFRAGCTISVNQDLTDPQPLVLRAGAGHGNDAFYLPSNRDLISIAEGAVVKVGCPGGKIILSNSATNLEISDATCRSGRFNIQGRTLSFSDITCSSLASHTARFNGRTCLGKHKEIEIGFTFQSRFIKHITACFDAQEQNTLYTVFELSSAIGGFQSGYPRPSWIEGNFYDLGSNKLDNLYSRKKQRATINALLGLNAASTKYIHASNDYFLSRGHLTAKAYFVFGSQQQLTFYFVNAAPQWQTFNGGNWMYLESDCRNFASSRGLDLTVYTGTHGVSVLPHEKTKLDTELYLFVSGNRKAIPVPQVYWKVMYDPVSKAGIAFVGVNNPYYLNMKKDILCTDICSQLNYLTWKPTHVPSGYSYCCAVDDLRKTVKNVPNFEVRSILK